MTGEPEDSAPRVDSRARFHELLDLFDAQRTRLAQARDALAAAQVTADSPDGLVAVTVNAAGVPVEVRVSKDAFRKSTPERLGQSFLAAARGAAVAARRESDRITAPVAEIADAAPDLPDLVPGAPSLRELRALLYRGDGDSDPSR